MDALEVLHHIQYAGFWFQWVLITAVYGPWSMLKMGSTLSPNSGCQVIPDLYLGCEGIAFRPLFKIFRACYLSFLLGTPSSLCWTLNFDHFVDWHVVVMGMDTDWDFVIINPFGANFFLSCRCVTWSSYFMIYSWHNTLWLLSPMHTTFVSLTFLRHPWPWRASVCTPLAKTNGRFFRTQKLTWCPHRICTIFGGWIRCIQLVISLAKYIKFSH